MGTLPPFWDPFFFLDTVLIDLDGSQFVGARHLFVVTLLGVGMQHLGKGQIRCVTEDSFDWPKSWEASLAASSHEETDIESKIIAWKWAH